MLTMSDIIGISSYKLSSIRSYRAVTFCTSLNYDHLVSHILSVEMFLLSFVALDPHLSLSCQKNMVLHTALLFISDCHQSARLGALPKALLCIGCVACGSLL